MPTHYIPSAVMFIHLLKNGRGYGVLPEQQSRALILNNDIIDLAPENKIRVKLYWHCWNLKSKLLQDFTRELLSGFKRMQSGSENLKS
jgi:LysR family transcriptional regulator (chromosome initiation inhibitor)